MKGTRVYVTPSSATESVCWIFKQQQCRYTNRSDRTLKLPLPVS